MITQNLDNQVESILSELRDGLQGLSIIQVYTIQGILNGMVYVAALNDRITYRGCKTRYSFTSNSIAQFFRSDRTVITPVKFLAEYLKEYWEGRAYHSRVRVGEMRNMMCQRFKIFTLEDRTELWKDPLNRHRSPNPCGEFNMLRALLLARAIEELLLTRFELEAEQLKVETAGNGNYEFERVEWASLPEHKAYTLGAIGKAAGIWTGCDRPHPGIREIIEIEALRIKAERQFKEVADDRTEEEILEQEFVSVTESNIVFSEGIAVVVEKIVDAMPLIALVRRSMLRVVSYGRKDGGVAIPAWVREKSEGAIAWWDRKLVESGWLIEFAPDWALDAIVPF